MIIVANAAVGRRPSIRASRYGRMTSPARGTKVLAAKPMTVVRNAFEKLAFPIGASSACHRHARSR